MTYPSFLEPNNEEEIKLLSGEKIIVPKKSIVLRSWSGEKLKNTFGGKPLVNFNGKPMFLEMCILKLGEISSWNGRWIQTYQMKGKKPYYLKEWVDDKLSNQTSIEIQDKTVNNLLEEISTGNKGYSGCWAKKSTGLIRPRDLCG
jgi:hypothetical protein